MPLNSLLSGVLCALALVVHAAPFLKTRQSITALTNSQVSAFKPFTYYAGIGYCTPSVTLSWSCGASCEVNSAFVPVASGGDGDNIQYWYVGYDRTLKTVIVVHQGTDLSKIMPIITDMDFLLGSFDLALFPSFSSAVKAHSGFLLEQAKTAASILSAVTITMSKFDTETVTTVGHSLGAALSLLDGVYLSLHLPVGTSIRSIGYGCPRIGNQAFADYVNAHVSFTHINNKEDVVPTLPGESLGYVHPVGEVHIEDSGNWMSCQGEDNPSPQCIVGDVPYIFDGRLSDHHGPYDGVVMDC